MANSSTDVLERTEVQDAPGRENPSPPGSAVGPGRASMRRLKPRTRLAVAGLGLLVLVSLFGLYRRLAAWESTDDAQIDGYIYPVSARVSGYVTRVMVDDHQYVEAGTVLVQLDGKDYEV